MHWPLLTSRNELSKWYRATEFLDFLKQIDVQAPPDFDVHVMDNYATHKAALVQS